MPTFFLWSTCFIVISGGCFKPGVLKTHRNTQYTYPFSKKEDRKKKPQKTQLSLLCLTIRVTSFYQTPFGTKHCGYIGCHVQYDAPCRIGMN